jgi:hypothetical protein
MPEYGDDVLMRLANVHRGVLRAGQARLDQDREQLLDEIDRAMADLVAIGALLDEEKP